MGKEALLPFFQVPRRALLYHKALVLVLIEGPVESRHLCLPRIMQRIRLTLVAHQPVILPVHS